MRPLEGVRVLDFGHFIAGPFCAALLADYGADVIRVERPQGAPDRYVQPLGDQQQSEGGVYLQMNRNKRSLTLDVFSEEGQAVIKRLLVDIDVVIANVPDKTLRAMGIDYASLKAINPQIILSTCNAFGANGDSRDRPGFDGIGQAMSGAMQMTGEGGIPRKAYAHYVDFSTAALSAFGVMVALFNRKNSGSGQQVETSLLETALAMMNGALMEQHLQQADRQGTGNLAQLAGPADVYRTSDGWILLQVLGNSMFRRWAKMIDREDLMNDPRFSDDSLRGQHGALLSQWMTEWSVVRSTEACLLKFKQSGLPAAPVYNFKQVLDAPEISAQGFWQMQNFPSIEGDVPVARTPVSLSETPAQLVNRAPVLGEHTDIILIEAGYSLAEVDALRSAQFV